ncbi:VWA domain-containing protein [Maricaulis sp. W15]|uniref:vWA domain-containing protein n=1 Tax=Maricaulis sp. W15 TaxID=1772333 RepID=UPI000A45FB72|nr:VWA domain-containing protein [Maricaulis sp. W15]
MRTGAVTDPATKRSRWQRLAHYGRLAAIVVLLGLTTAYDTKESARAGAFSGHVTDANKWHGIYYCHQSSRDNCHENEHAWLAQVALDRVAPNSPWGFSPTHRLTVRDLATGYFRSEIGSSREGSTWDPDDVMGLPQRTVPGAANFAGIPDFSYSLYDWINRNELCPPMPNGQMPAGTPADCHNYMYWQGGGFNASHFGSQATRSYQQLHATAMGLAARARRLRERMADDPANIEAYRDVVREAEMEALAFEGYAQHFLQDRWAMGHMFERWGSPEYNANGIALDPTRALMAGAFTGIIHGYQSVAAVPDALSSPEVGVVNTVVNVAARGFNWIGNQLGLTEPGDPPATRLEIANWRRPGDEEQYPGVGDYLAWDMQRGRYAARVSLPGHIVEYNSETALPVQRQYNELMACSSSGFRDVIRAFGSDGNGFGIDGVALNELAGESLGPHCFNAWATNEAIVFGMGNEFAAAGAISTLAQAGFRIGNVINEVTGNATTEDLPPEMRGFIYSRNDTLSVTRIYVRARMAAFADPSGLNMAQGGLGTLLGVPTGDVYPAASYLEPAAITTLPDRDPRGRDAQTVFGFFNRSHADYFCRQSDTLLPQLRGSADDNERATCRILAQRLYDETDDATGISEHAFVDLNGSRERTEPLCRIVNDNWSAPRFGGDRIDTLHPGYVSWDFSADQSRAFAMDDAGLAMQSVANWCDQTPVVDALSEEELAVAGVVAVLEDTRDTIEIRGRHFGDTAGELRLGLNPGSAVAVTDIVDWSDTRIRFRVAEIFSDISFADPAGGSGTGDSHTYVFVSRAETGNSDPGRASAGRFVLRREVEIPRLVSVNVTARGEDLPLYAYVEPPAEDAFGADPETLFETPALPPPDPEDRAFRPVLPGAELTIELRFGAEIERDAEGQILTLGGEPLDGRWLDSRRWRGRFDVADGDAYDALRGPLPLQVSVQSRRGAWTDGDPQTVGAQPNEDHQLLVDRIPTHLERIEVRAGNRTVYRAEWQGGPDYDAERELTSYALGAPVRTLDVDVARAVSETGQGRMRLEFSGPLAAAPIVTVGGATATVDGENARWEARFDLETAATLRDENGDLQVTVSLEGQPLDADPASAVVINDPAQWRSGQYWAGLEALRAGAVSAQGGPDSWHRLGEGPALSLLIILDGSGSMNDGNRLANARAGITQTFENLPEDQVIEFAAVAFSGCGGFTTRRFTRDAAGIRDFLVSASASGGTPLAAAHDRARSLFTSFADPRAQEWRYASFTDGAETCDGNVAGSIRQLESVLAQHRAPDATPPPEPAAAPPPQPPVNCQAETWSGYAVEVTDGGRHLDRITLIEHSYIERVLPDGRCLAVYEVKDYGVYYGRTRQSGLRWGINSRPSETVTDVGRSSRGRADMDRVRNRANQARGNLVELPEARRRVGDAVSRAEPESG